MADEIAELAERVSKLATFIESDYFHDVARAEQMRLIRQHVFMRGYLEVLSERVAAWTA